MENVCVCVCVCVCVRMLSTCRALIQSLAKRLRRLQRNQRAGLLAKFRCRGPSVRQHSANLQPHPGNVLVLGSL
jgi:hypothetical protein